MNITPQNLRGSVGRGGANLPADVKLVQELLNRHIVESPRWLAVDGICGPKTIAAITEFQTRRFGKADGRVDPGHKTIQSLTGAVAVGQAGAVKAGFVSPPLPPVEYPRWRIELDKWPPIVQAAPEYTMEIRLKGSITVQQVGALPWTLTKERLAAELPGLRRAAENDIPVMLKPRVELDWRNGAPVVDFRCPLTTGNANRYYQLQTELRPPNRFVMTLRPEPIRCRLGPPALPLQRQWEIEGSLGLEISIVSTPRLPRQRIRVELPAPKAQKVLLVVAVGATIVALAAFPEAIPYLVVAGRSGQLASALPFAQAFASFAAGTAR